MEQETARLVQVSCPLCDTLLQAYGKDELVRIYIAHHRDMHNTRVAPADARRQIEAQRPQR